MEYFVPAKLFDDGDDDDDDEDAYLLTYQRMLIVPAIAYTYGILCIKQISS